MTDKEKVDWESVEILESLDVSEKVLLTGAGFTANFGTPLAKEMWSLIHNHIAAKQNIQNKSHLMKTMNKFAGDYDYESAYCNIMKKNNQRNIKMQCMMPSFMHTNILIML